MEASEFLHNPSDSDSGHNGDIGNGSNSLDEDLDDSPTLDTVSGFSSCSSPLPNEPFQPQFIVKFTDNVVKDGEVVKYTIKSIPANRESGASFLVQRQYEDFEWLTHCLLTSNNILGLIVPPLPPKPAITSEMAEAKSKKQLGNKTRTLMGDDFYKDCRQLEEYLNLLLAHPVFGTDVALEKFLTELEAPARTRIKKGLLSRITESISSQKDTHKDCEEFFQKERDWVKMYGHLIKESNQCVDAMTYSQQRLCGVLGHLATALTLCMGGNNMQNEMRECTVLSESLESLKQGMEVESFLNDSTFGACLELYCGYIDGEREMLVRRTNLLIDYETSNRNMDVAKPNRREAAEEAKLKAEKTFEDCSDVARQEIKRFHRQRVQMFSLALEKFAESQVRNAREVYSVLAKSLTTLQQMNPNQHSA